MTITPYLYYEDVGRAQMRATQGLYIDVRGVDKHYQRARKAGAVR